MRRKQPTSLRIDLGSAIRSAREEQRISLRRFGLMTGMDYKYVSLIECGEANATIDTIEKIAQGLGLEVRDLFWYSVESDEGSHPTNKPPM